MLAVQTRANADLKAANTDLAASNEREPARFMLAQEAIRMFHTGVSEDLLLKQKDFRELRTQVVARGTGVLSQAGGATGRAGGPGFAAGAGAHLLRGGRAHDGLDSMTDALAGCTSAPGPVPGPGEQDPNRRRIPPRGRKACLGVSCSLAIGQNAEALAAAERACALPRIWPRLTPPISNAEVSWRGPNTFVESFSGLNRILRVVEGFERRGRSRRTS